MALHRKTRGVAPQNNSRVAAAKPAYVVTDVEDLEYLRHPSRANRGMSVRLVAPNLPSDRRAQFERQLSRDAGACGCKEGGTLALTYLVVAGIFFVYQGAVPNSFIGWSAAVAGFAASLLFGKLLGVTIARMRLARTLRVLRVHLTAPMAAP
jgi:membrane associated rhomboid family serine protease